MFFFSLADLSFQRANQSNAIIMTNKYKPKRASDEELRELCANKTAEKLKTKMKSMFDQALEDIRKTYEEEIAALRAQIVQMKQNQDFVCAVVVLEMCKCTGAPPLLGGPPFDLSRAEKFDYEKL